MLRLTGGQFRGRLIEAPRHDRTRPTQAKLRQAVFNSLQALIPDSKVLDLFAGSGALGFEALSRGAVHVTFVESDRTACKLIEKNARALGCLDRVLIVPESVDRAWAKIASQAPFDLVFADPPYAGGWEDRLLREFPWSRALAESGIFCLEWGTQKTTRTEAAMPERTALETGDFLVKIREKNYGDSMLTTFQRTAA